MKYFYLLTILLFFIVSCKKKNTDTNETIGCGIANNTLVINGTSNTVIIDTAYTTTTGNYILYKVNDSTGISLLFGNNVLKTENTYSITENNNEISKTSNKVFTNFFLNGVVNIAKTGTVKIRNNSNTYTIELCGIYFFNSPFDLIISLNANI